MTDPTPIERRRMLGLVAGMFGLLALQNLAGIWLNLYVSVRDTTSYDGVFPAMFASDAGAVHAIVGLLIGGNAILALARTWSWSDSGPRWVAAISLLLVAVASYLGFHFVQSGGDDLYSLGMEIAFMGIVLCQAALLYLVAVRPEVPPGAPVAATA
jgi:hypothetical protein